MRTVLTIAALRTALAGPRAAGARIGLVPTMGAFHAGHLSLMRRARAESDVVVVSLFVNPAQFAPHEDLAVYPRDEPRDATLAAEAGVDLLFAPTIEEIYPAGFATSVAVAGLTEPLCGRRRGPEHFHGVTTVVAKLLNIVQPHAAYFGEKDAQQLVVVRRLVRDLDIPVEIVGCPIVREPDGLALSSRNAYLSAEERVNARALAAALDAASALVAAGERAAEPILATARATLTDHGLEPEYVELVDPETLAPLAALDGPALLALAARVGRAHLIDNATLTPTTTSLTTEAATLTR